MFINNIGGEGEGGRVFQYAKMMGNKYVQKQKTLYLNSVKVSALTLHLLL